MGSAIALRALLDNRSLALIVDLADTTYLDSAGITSSSGSPSELRSRQQQLGSWSSDASPIARMVALTGLDRAMPVHRTLPDALGELRDDPT